MYKKEKIISFTVLIDSKMALIGLYMTPIIAKM